MEKKGSPEPVKVEWVETDKLRYHEEAGKLIPEMTPQERKNLYADLDERGIQEPLQVAPDGKTVLDGRHRLGWAKDRKRSQVPTIRAKVDGLDEAALVEFAVLAALLRRQLTDGQRLCLAADLYDRLSKREKEERSRKAGKAGGRGRQKDSSPDSVQAAGS